MTRNLPLQPPAPLPTLPAGSVYIGGTSLLLPVQVEELYGITRAELKALRRRGCGPRAVQFGRYYLYPRSAIINWVKLVAAADRLGLRRSTIKGVRS